MLRRESPSEIQDPGRLAALRRTGLLESGPEESFERLGELARRLTGASAALVSLLDEDRQHFKCCVGLAEPWAKEGETPLSHSICKYTLQAGEPLVIADTTAEPMLVGNGAVEELGIGAYLGVPLIGAGGYVLGSFCVLASEPRRWSDDDVSVMVDLAASVMAEIGLRELMGDQRRQVLALNRSEDRLRAIMDGLFIFAGLLDTDGTVLDANNAALEAAGLSGDEVVGRPFWEAYWWSWDSSVQKDLQGAIDLAARGVKSRYDVYIRLAEDNYIPIDFQLAPLIEDGEVVRLIPSGLDISERKRFEQEIARSAAIEAEHRQRAENLLELSRVLNSATTIGQVAASVASIGSVATTAAFSNIAIKTGDGTGLEVRHGEQLDLAIGDRWPRVALDDSTPLGAAVTTQRAQYLGSTAEILRRFPSGADDVKTAGFQSLAALPLPGGDAAVGFAWTEPTDFDGPVAGAMNMVAELTGQALRRASEADKNRRIAERLQRSLLPQELPAIPGVELASRYEAGADGLDVGGDWFDVGLLGDGRWVLAVGDVVGRGLNAAAAMGRLRNAFAALTANAVDLDRLLERMDMAAAEADESGFSTLLVVEYSTQSGRISALSAGHPPPFIRRSGGQVVRLDGSGRPLGSAYGRERIALSETLEVGDVLFLYTDGLVERRAEPIDVGLDRLAAVLSRIETVSAQSLCQSVLAQLGHDSSDDVAMLALVVVEKTLVTTVR